MGPFRAADQLVFPTPEKKSAQTCEGSRARLRKVLPEREREETAFPIRERDKPTVSPSNSRLQALYDGGGRQRDFCLPCE
jgi:hypothetical protein